MAIVMPTTGVVDKRAEDAEIRAEIAKTRAAEARAHAVWDDLNGFERVAGIRRREAAMHERAAARQQQAAELQRLHSAMLRTTPAQPVGASAPA